MIKNGRPYTIEYDGKNIDDGLITSKPIELQQQVCAWIRRNFLPDCEPNMHHTSYGLKHYFQRETGEYLTNNEFKDAMMLCGFYPEDPDELNWNYYISEESPLFTGISFEKRILRKNGFFAYMMQFDPDEETHRGKLVRDMKHDASFPVPCGCQEGMDYLTREGAYEELKEEFWMRWMDWYDTLSDEEKREAEKLDGEDRL